MKTKLFLFIIVFMGTFYSRRVIAHENLTQTVMQSNITSNKDSKPILNPLNPDEKIIVQGTIDQNFTVLGGKGSLTIDYVSDFQFGTQDVVQKDDAILTIHPKKQEAILKSEPSKKLSLPIFIQISDTRGLDSGWQLLVSQKNQFYSSETEDNLWGAQIVLKNSKFNDNSMNQIESSENTIYLVPNGDATRLATSDDFLGTTAFVYWFLEDITLSVPGNSGKPNTKYRTDIQWQLVDVPNN